MNKNVTINMELYPLKFSPVFKYRIWGGEKLRTELNKKYSGHNIGESWEISDISGDETRVINGELLGKTLKELIREYKGDFVGKNVFSEFGENFPLLIKFIDAKTPLSIQVHPSNEIARVRHSSFGKNEMWYVVQADNNSELIVGFDEEINAQNFNEHISNNSILEVMHRENEEVGPPFYIPTGRVHAIGAGVLLAEIQQTSDITYRIYDYDRVDAKTGKKRDLHNEMAIDVIDYKVYKNYKSSYQIEQNKCNKLVYSPFFKTNIIKVNGILKRDYKDLDSFVIYICVDGSFVIDHNEKSYTLKKGETILLPSCVNQVDLKSNASKLIEVFM